MDLQCEFRVLLVRSLLMLAWSENKMSRSSCCSMRTSSANLYPLVINIVLVEDNIDISHNYVKYHHSCNTSLIRYSSHSSGWTAFNHLQYHLLLINVRLVHVQR